MKAPVEERLAAQRKLIAIVEQGTFGERVWLPILRLAHRLTLREQRRAAR